MDTTKVYYVLTTTEPDYKRPGYCQEFGFDTLINVRNNIINELVSQIYYSGRKEIFLNSKNKLRWIYEFHNDGISMENSPYKIIYIHNEKWETDCYIPSEEFEEKVVEVLNNFILKPSLYWVCPDYKGNLVIRTQPVY